MSKHFWAWFRVRKFLWDERGQDQSVIRDHLDHGRSNKPMNPCPEWIHQFIWSTMIRVISDHWSWSGSSQRNAPLHKRHDSLYIISFTILEKWFTTYFQLARNTIMRNFILQISTWDWLISKFVSKCCLSGLASCGRTVKERKEKEQVVEYIFFHLGHWKTKTIINSLFVVVEYFT